MAARRRSRIDHARLVDDLHARLDERVGELATSDDWLAYLDAARRFHRYSPNNQLLLALQGAEGHVASYNTWRKIPATGGGTCQVARGEKGLTILAPITGRTVEINDDTDDAIERRRLRGFKTTKVFHQGQLIDPPDLPEPVMPSLLVGDDRWQHVWWAVAGSIEADGFDVAHHTRTPDEKWNGRTSWTDRQVLIADDLEPPQALKTLLHEWGHIELDHETRTGLERSVKEVEAESVAYLLAQTVGLDSGDYSLPYITAWAGGDITRIRHTAEHVLTTTKRLVESLEIDLGIELAPDLIAQNTIDDPESQSAGTLLAAGAVPEVPESDREVASEKVPLPGIGAPTPDSRPRSLSAASHGFLTAILDDLEPEQRDRVMARGSDATAGGEVAVILAESGKSATQVARVLDHFDHDVESIRDLLLHPVPDSERPTLFTIADARSALSSIDGTLDLDGLVPLVERPTGDDLATSGAGEQVADLRLVQRALRRHDEPARIAALAYGLDLEPAAVIGVCRASGIEPSRTMDVAIAVRNGDPRAAYTDVTTAWSDVAGGWEQHTHPSLRQPEPRNRHLAAVPDYEPARDILDRWTGRTIGPASSGPRPEPVA